MVNLLIGNCFNEEIAGDPRRIPAEALPPMSASAQVIVWFAQDNDVVVLPELPNDELVEYITNLTGTDPSTLRFVVPRRGVTGTALLTADRLTGASLRDGVREALFERPVDRITALTPDAAVADLAAELGYTEALPGYAFLAQGGGTLVNSKAAFRAVAAGSAVPIPKGGVARSMDDALRLVGGLIENGRPAMLKRDFSGGGMGNEIVSPTWPVRALGARRVVHATDPESVRSYLEESWEWLSNGGRFPVVCEEYLAESRAIFAEFRIEETGPVYEEQGEMFYSPLVSGQVVPVIDLPQRVLADLVSAGTRLCQSLHALGFRGAVGADAVLTPDGSVYYTEINCRITGSTHLHKVIGSRLVGASFGRTRMLTEYFGWIVPSFTAAVERLHESKLAYDGDAQTGVVLDKAFSEVDSSVRYVVIAGDRDAISSISHAVEQLFPRKAKTASTDG